MLQEAGTKLGELPKVPVNAIEDRNVTQVSL
jgi:hypothetical protein